MLLLLINCSSSRVFADDLCALKSAVCVFMLSLLAYSLPTCVGDDVLVVDAIDLVEVGEGC